jgi:nicotinamidase-related amidase
MPLNTLKNTPENPALLLIDIQKGFVDLDYFGGERNNLDAEANCGILLACWRRKQWPTFHIGHCSVNAASPLVEGKPGNEFRDEIKPLPGEPVLKKSVNSAFIGTGLQQMLDTAGIKTLVIVGLITQHCISTTARMAGNLGYKTFVVSDATAAFQTKGLNGEIFSAQMTHDLSLATIHMEFGDVVTMDELIDRFELKPEPQELKPEPQRAGPVV